MRTTPAVIAAAAIFVFAPALVADVIWDEAVQGDLSGNRLSPTLLDLGVGTHRIRASTGFGDLEYFTITVPAGAQFSQLINVSYEGVDPVAFAGIQAGPTITQGPNDLDPTSLLGWAHFGPGLHTVGEDFLDDMGLGFGAIGFTPPLPAGTYAFWIQQLGDTVEYELDFVIVPTPHAAVVLLTGGLLGVRRRR